MTMRAPVQPANAIQKRIRQAEDHAQRPDANVVKHIRIVIDRVWTRREREEEGAPEQRSSLLARNPGMIMIEGQDLNGKRHVVSLGISVDEMYSVYGNAASLRGRPALIEYRNEDASYGRVFLKSDDLNLPLRDDEMIETYDIGVAL